MKKEVAGAAVGAAVGAVVTEEAAYNTTPMIGVPSIATRVVRTHDRKDWPWTTTPAKTTARAAR